MTEKNQTTSYGDEEGFREHFRYGPPIIAESQEVLAARISEFLESPEGERLLMKILRRTGVA